MNNLKNKYVIDSIFIITILILNGWTSIPRYKDVSNFERPPPVISEMRDSDIVMMKAIGNQTSTNYIGVDSPCKPVRVVKSIRYVKINAISILKSC